MNKAFLARIKPWFPYFSSSVLLVFTILILFNIVWYFTRNGAKHISKDVIELAEILKKIDKQCGIIGFDAQKITLNFLTIKKGGFTGSEVGSLRLLSPQNWAGPYLSHNKHIQGREYQLVHTKQGIFVAPGEGVKLPGGAIIGRDLLLHEDADILRMLKTERQLLYKGHALAVRLPIGSSCTMHQRQVIFPENDN